MLVAMESPSRISAGLVKSKKEESLVSAFSRTTMTLGLWKLKSRLRMKSAGGITKVLLKRMEGLEWQGGEGFLAATTTPSAATTSCAGHRHANHGAAAPGGD